jgi:hypothetical protein
MSASLPIDPNDPNTWPPHLREAQICKKPGYPGILPITSTAFRDAVARGYIEPPIRFGRRINCWRKDYIQRLQRDGIPRRPVIGAARSQDKEMRG